SGTAARDAGPVITVKIPKDRDGRPKQFAFVNFKHEESVPYGLRLLNGIKLYGRPMRIQFRSGTGGTLTSFLEGKYERVPDGMASLGFPSSLQRQAVVRAHTHRQSRHFGRDRFGEPGLDYGRGKRDDYGFDERGHEAEHHYRGGREEHYDRHRDSWSYEYRRESYREAKWHSARH
uniref:RRM domain-containing protein n=1 Tax=Zosterops lateralis melanops TaxID=1220523 RepID=A0A8D2PMU1_ZOSLA